MAVNLRNCCTASSVAQGRSGRTNSSAQTKGGRSTLIPHRRDPSIGQAHRQAWCIGLEIASTHLTLLNRTREIPLLGANAVGSRSLNRSATGRCHNQIASRISVGVWTLGCKCRSPRGIGPILKPDIIDGGRCRDCPGQPDVVESISPARWRRCSTHRLAAPAAAWSMAQPAAARRGNL